MRIEVIKTKPLSGEENKDSDRYSRESRNPATNPTKILKIETHAKSSKSNKPQDYVKKSSISKKFIIKNTQFFIEKLIEQNTLLKKKKKLLIVFVSLSKMQELNFHYLKKNRPTDILSFSPIEEDGLGELLLCEQQIKKQAKAHKLLFEEEMMYLILHGLLHLLGYQHEKGGPSAKKMYQLQDQLFELWLKNKPL